jgi:hypothetical protein
MLQKNATGWKNGSQEMSTFLVNSQGRQDQEEDLLKNNRIRL